jgi:hypothetical protein
LQHVRFAQERQDCAISRTFCGLSVTSGFWRHFAMMPHERRLSTRKTPDNLAYISLPSDNGGIVIDVSEGGLAFHAVAPVEADGPIHFRFAMDSSERVTAVGELAWKDEEGKTCGLRFTELPDEVREQIRVWIGQSNSRANFRANSWTNPSAFDRPAVRPLFNAAAGSNGELAPMVAAANPLVHNLKTAVYGLPSKKLALLPLELDFRAGATAAVVPQFVQMLDGMAEQVRIWVAESKTYGRNNPSAGPAHETYIAPKSKTELSPVVDLPMSETAIESEAAPSGKAELAPVAAARNPLLYNSKPPIHSRPSNTFSMFQLEQDFEEGAPAFAVPRPVAMKHPIAAVGLTIALAFLVSTGIFSYVCTSRAGDFLFNWGEKMWGGVNSQPISQNPAPVASSVPDSSKPPQQ